MVMKRVRVWPRSLTWLLVGFAVASCAPGMPGTATVEGLPGQDGVWSGSARCTNTYSHAVEFTADYEDSSFRIDVVPPVGSMEPRIIIGGGQGSVVEFSGNAFAGRMVATDEDFTACYPAGPNETPDRTTMSGFRLVCPYQDIDLQVTVTWECPEYPERVW